jgi:hypothetical protein
MATQSNSKNSKSKMAKPAPAPVVRASVKPAKAGGSYEPSPDEIGVRAFEIYVSEGCQDGKDLEHWLRAEQELRSQRSR